MLHSFQPKDDSQYHDSSKENDDSDGEPGKSLNIKLPNSY